MFKISVDSAVCAFGIVVKIFFSASAMGNVPHDQSYRAYLTDHKPFPQSFILYWPFLILWLTTIEPLLWALLKRRTTWKIAACSPQLFWHLKFQMVFHDGKGSLRQASHVATEIGTLWKCWSVKGIQGKHNFCIVSSTDGGNFDICINN